MAKEDWQKIWANSDGDHGADLLRLERETHTLRWHQMQEQIETRLGPIPSLSTIEVGAGLGDFSVIFNKLGARTCLADYSAEAIKRARERFDKSGLEAEFVLADMLDVPLGLRDKYDVSFSLGLAEHFYKADRNKIIKAHLDVLKPGGLAFISIPYRYSPLYRIWMAHRKLQGRWEYGLEVPFSKKEITALGEQAGFKTIGFIQSSFFADWNSFYPQHRAKRLFGNKFEQPSRMNALSYALVYVGQRPSTNS